MVDVTAPFLWVVFSLQDKLGGPKWCDGHHTAFALLLAFKLTHLESDTSLSTDKQTIPSNSCFATSKPGSFSKKKKTCGEFPYGLKLHRFKFSINLNINMKTFTNFRVFKSHSTWRIQERRILVGVCFPTHLDIGQK